MSRPAALGFRTHSGWAVVTAVTASPFNGVVLARRRIEIADAALPGSRQPFHAAAALDELSAAEVLIHQRRESSTWLAALAVREMIVELAEKGHTVACASIIMASGRPLPDLAATLKSHALIHTAEGEFFRDVLQRASEECGLPVTKLRARDVWNRGAEAFGVPVADLQKQIAQVGRAIGPPWRDDHQLASLAAWIALAEVVR
jgi:hypothetical protein